MIDLAKLCTEAGMNPDDAGPAVGEYLRRGPLSTADLLDLIGQSEADRSVSLAARYGSDASRVAMLVASR